MTEPMMGRKTMAAYISALHHVDVLNRDGAAVAEIDHKNGKPDCRFGGGDGEHEQGEDLADQIAQIGREGHEIDAHRQEDQFHRHQDDDDVLAVEENAHHPDGEQDSGDSQVIGQPDGHAPAPGLRSCMSTAMAAVRAFWTEITWRRTPGRDRNVSTMDPIIATSSTMPAVWK